MRNPAQVPFSNDTTSRLGAQFMAGDGRAATQVERVRRVLESVGEDGLTDGEIALHTGLGARQASTRRNALVRAGKVVDSGRTRVVAGVCRLPCIVWVRRDIPPAAATTVRGRRARERAALGEVMGVLDGLRTIMLQELQAIDADERFHYPSASVVVNAPLALVQLNMEICAEHAKRVLRALGYGGPELYIEPGPRKVAG